MAVALSEKPRESTQDHIAFLWRLVAAHGSPTRAVEALQEKSGLSNSRCWDIWRYARAQWENEKPVGRNVGLSLCWHQAQDALLVALNEIRGGRNDGTIWRRYHDFLKICVDISRAMGPDEFKYVSEQRTVTSHEIVLRMEKEIATLAPDERRVAVRVLGAVLGGIGSLPEAPGSVGNEPVGAAKPTGT